ncbi:MAG: phosphate ABC transporter permease subunit PstC [Faecalibacterium sp.]|jgi:phosphate transport system permease protein|nr:phosphate ABC transporter permease subunit PstC [Faecalibacterium sp.]
MHPNDPTALPKKPRETIRKLTEAIMNGVFFVCGAIAVLCVLLISVYMIVAGVPAIRQIGLGEFLLGTSWKSTAAEPSYGILPFILTSICGTLGAVAIGVPLGLLTSVLLAKAAPKKLAGPVSGAIELLSGIPSVVYGLLGMTVLVPAVAKAFSLSSGACLFSAILVLSVMILPGIVSVSTTALNAVPPEYEQGSLALGATDAETWFKISIPAARSGIAAGVVLGIGRAVGEAMAVMMVAGNVANMPGIFQSVTFLTTAIAKEMSYASGLQRQALFSIALVLFVFIMLLNAVLNLVLKGGKTDEK